MEIDKLFDICLNKKYEGTIKEQFYIGKITFISSDLILAQFENLNSSASKILFGEHIQPNKIDSFVLINTNTKILLGTVEQIKLKDTDNVHSSLNQQDDESIYPIERISILGSVHISEEKDIQICLEGFEYPGLTDKVYACPRKIIEKLHSEIYRIQPTSCNSICIGTYYSNQERFRISIDDLYQQHLLTIGSTGSGKSTTSLSIMEKSIQKGVKYLIIDPTGEYSKSFKNLNVLTHTLGDKLCVENGKINITQWGEMVKANDNSQPAALNEAIHMLKQQQGVIQYIGTSEKDIQKYIECHENDNKNFDFSQLPDQLSEYSSKPVGGKYIKDDFKLGSVIYLIEKIRLLKSNLNFMDIFNNHKEDVTSLESALKEFYDSEKSIYINCSKIDDISVMSAFISILIDMLFRDTQCGNINHPFVIYIDEVHRYIEKMTAREAIIRIAREGRKYGMFLSLTTQSPHDIPDILLGQIGTFIIHRISNEPDMEKIIPLLKEKKPLQYLGQGEAIINSVHLKRDIQVHVEKSKLEHNSATPSLISNLIEKKNH